MKLFQFDEYKVRIIDNDTARFYLSAVTLLITLIALTASTYITIKNNDIQWMLVSIPFLAIFLVLGIYGILSQQSIVCDIDKSMDSIQIKSKKLGRENISYLAVHQVLGIGLKEVASTYYYTYKVGFIVYENKYVPLSVYSYVDQNRIIKLSHEVAEFLAVEVIALRDDSPIASMPPGF